MPVVPSVNLTIDGSGTGNGTTWMIIGTNGANIPNAVPVIRRGTNNAEAILVICPVNHLIWMGDGDLFRSANDNEETRRFMYNLVTFANNAARYGEHFMYLFRRDSSLPAIWDSQWGSNTNVDFTWPANLRN